MAIITQANLQSLTDRLGGGYDQALSFWGNSADAAAPLANTVMRQALNALNVIVVTADDVQQQTDLNANLLAFAGIYGQALGTAYFANPVKDLNTHAVKRGGYANLNAYMTFLNSVTKFTSLLSPSYAALHLLIMGAALSNQNVFSPALHPVNGNAAGMGTFTFGGAFGGGVAVDTSKYAEVNLLAELTVSQVGPSVGPVITATGTDHLGNAGQTWTATLPTGGLTAALALTHTGGATTASLLAGAFTTFTVANTAGIVPGSVLVVNADAGLNNSEVLIVNTVPNGTTFTAWTRFAHANNCTLTGNYSIALTNGSARRNRSVSNITYAGTGLSAGAIRVIGVQDRARF